MRLCAIVQVSFVVSYIFLLYVYWQLLAGGVGPPLYVSLAGTRFDPLLGFRCVFLLVPLGISLFLLFCLLWLKACAFILEHEIVWILDYIYYRYIVVWYRDLGTNYPFDDHTQHRGLMCWPPSSLHIFRSLSSQTLLPLWSRMLLLISSSSWWFVDRGGSCVRSVEDCLLLQSRFLFGCSSFVFCLVLLYRFSCYLLITFLFYKISFV